MKNKILSPEEKLLELEQELEYQKQRFFHATKKTEDNIHSLFSITNWIREYPLQAAVLAMSAGIALTQIRTNIRSNTSNPPKNV